MSWPRALKRATDPKQVKKLKQQEHQTHRKHQTHQTHQKQRKARQQTWRTRGPRQDRGHSGAGQETTRDSRSLRRSRGAKMGEELFFGCVAAAETELELPNGHGNRAKGTAEAGAKEERRKGQRARGGLPLSLGWCLDKFLHQTREQQA